MNDLISRQDAIEGIYQLLKELPNKKNSALFKDGVRDGYARAIGRIRSIPSANVPDTNVGELIRRQDAVDSMRKYEIELPTYAPREIDVVWDDAIDACCDAVEALPSAQPEIIRCKDCKHWHNAPASDGLNSCEKDALIRHKYFFCADAEF